MSHWVRIAHIAFELRGRVEALEAKIEAALALCERNHYLHHANGVDELARAVKEALRGEEVAGE